MAGRGSRTGRSARPLSGRGCGPGRRRGPWLLDGWSRSSSGERDVEPVLTAGVSDQDHFHRPGVKRLVPQARERVDVRGPPPAVGAGDRDRLEHRGRGDLGQRGEALAFERRPSALARSRWRRRVDRGVLARIRAVTLTWAGSPCHALLACAPSITSSTTRLGNIAITMSASSRPSSGCERRSGSLRPERPNSVSSTARRIAASGLTNAVTRKLSSATPSSSGFQRRRAKSHVRGCDATRPPAPRPATSP